MQDEAITINDKILQYGVLSNADGNYQLYLYPGMTVAEIAFDVMVTIRALLIDGYIKSADEFTKLVIKYLTDPQYAISTVKENKKNEKN